MNISKIIFIVLVIFSILLGLIIGLIVHAKNSRCWPFKYGGFTEKNGYEDIRKAKKF